MSSKRDSFLTVRTDFGASGLDLSGSSLRTDETSLQRTENAYVGFRGTMEKRPEFKTMGTPIIEPTSPATTTESVSMLVGGSPSDWETTTRTEDNAIMTPHASGLLNFYCTKSNVSSSASHVVTRLVQGNESYNVNALWDKSFAVGFTLRTNSLFSTSMTADGSPGLVIGVAVAKDKYLRFGISELGVYVRTPVGLWVVLNNSAGIFTTGSPVQVELRMFNNVSNYFVSLYVDGVLINSTPLTMPEALEATSGQFIDVSVINLSSQNADELCAGDLSAFYLRDVVDNITETASIEEVFTRHKAREETLDRDVRIFVATKKHLWFDENLSGMWRYGGPLLYPKVSVVDFRDSTIILNYADQVVTRVTQILNDFSIRVMDDAPNIRFATTHNNRLWGAGDSKYPLRVYFSGDRDPNKWFSPDTDADGQETFDEILSSGYFEMDGESGDSVRAIFGDYRGSIIIATNRKLFRITGTDINSWNVEKLDDSVGALGPNCIERVGNDLWVVGEDGVVMLQAIQGYGDLASVRATAPIQSLFTKVSSRPTSLIPQLRSETILTYEKTSDTVYLLLRQPDGFDDEIYAFRLGTTKWFGPWKRSTTSISLGTVGVPSYEAIILGNSSGEVSFRTSIQDKDASIEIRSQMISGRSIDPSLPSMEKTWRNIRIMANPTGDWPLTIDIKVEDSPWVTHTAQLARSTSDTVSVDWEVNASVVGSAEEMHVIDFGTELRGKTLEYKITTSEDKMSLIAAEVEFSADGFEKGD